MPLLITPAELDRLCRESEAYAIKFRNTPCQDIPKAERQAEIDRYIAIVNSDPHTLAVTLAENKDVPHTDEDRRLLYGKDAA